MIAVDDGLKADSTGSDPGGAEQEAPVRTVPARNPVLVLASVFGAFCAGPALGVVVAHHTAPGSGLAQVVSPAAFALAFAGGLLLWFGIGFTAAAGEFFRGLWRGGWRRRPPAPAAQLLPPGHGAFLPLGLAAGLLAGVVAGLAPASASFRSACALHVAAGAAYGALLRALARSGYLPFEPS